MAIASVLPWFAEVELSLSENWFPFLSKISGKVGEELKSLELELRTRLGLRREQIKEITLGDRLNLYLESAKQFDVPLTEASQPMPAELTQIRNLFAHGTILRELKRRWEAIFDLLLWFYPTYRKVLVVAKGDKV